jgi:hypothetical protein
MINHNDENRIIVLDGDEADTVFREAMEGKQEALTELLNEHDTLTVSRSAFAATIKQLLTQLPDMLASSAENMPVYARAAMPVVRMLLASDEMQQTLSSDGIVDFVWKALEQCQ